MAGRAPTPRPIVPAARAAGGPRFAIAAARFNEAISKRLVDGALAVFAAAGLGSDAVDVHWVPGAFELPLAAHHLAASRRYAGVVCVGVVIRGQTPHFEHVAREAAAGIRQVALATGVPVTFGVVTALGAEQAWERAGGAVGNRGAEAAEAAIEMAALVHRLGQPPAAGPPAPRALPTAGAHGRRRLPGR